MKFENLEQRVVQAYIDLLPSFVPEDHAAVSILEQKEFYDLIRGLYQLAFHEPLLFVSSLHEDDAYPGPIKSSYGKPELQITMKKMMKSVDMLLQNMLLMGKGCQIKLTKRQNEILARLGVRELDKINPAWVWMSTRPDSSLSTFSFCLFKKDYPYTSHIYARLLGETAFRKLEGWMIAQGYKRFDICDVTASDCKLSLTYANPAWSPKEPNGGFEYKIRHTGISARYDVCFANPVVFGLCIPGGLKTYLEAFDLANHSVQRFIVEHTKKCDGCRYCVQTDKTGKRPLAQIKVMYGGKAFRLCPYFPGYGFSWSGITQELAERATEMLDFMDKFANRAK